MRARDVDTMWAKFEMEIRQGADIKADLWVDGKMILRTYRSHGSGKMSGNIPKFIRQQMRLNEAEFEDAINCPLKRDGYIEILRRKGHIT
jgi:hypothetical protein